MKIVIKILDVIIENNIEYFSFNVEENILLHKKIFKICNINNTNKNYFIKIWKGLGKLPFKKGTSHARINPSLKFNFLFNVNDNLIITDKFSKKICMFFSLNDYYYIGFEIYMISLLKYNPKLDIDILILDMNLSECIKTKIKMLYKKIIFKKVNKDNYKNKFIFSKEYIQKLDNPRFVNNFYKMDVFSYEEYDTIICSDCDMLVLDNISDILKYREDIYGCVKYNNNEPIQGGLIIIGKKYINKYTYHKLLYTNKFCGPLAEQDIYEKTFNFKILDKCYNVEKRLLWKDKNYSITDKDLELRYLSNYFNTKNSKKNIKILHYVGYKPWEVNNDNYKYFEVNRLWFDFYNLNRKKKKLIIIGNSDNVLSNNYGILMIDKLLSYFTWRDPFQKFLQVRSI